MKVKMAAKDKLWGSLVKERDQFTCQRCFIVFPEGRRQGLHAHHIFGRSRRKTRWMIQNGVSLCFGCHMWAHSNPLEFHERMRDRLGSPEYDELRQTSLGVTA
jgi:5-methylcytosine-specific restriction endonuclease McrA